MFDVSRQWRLFLLLVVLQRAAVAQTPAMTTVSDTVYRADGSPAQGTLLISWPEFTTASGQAVAAGTKSVTLGAGGTLSVALVPTANAIPANTVYTVVYQLSDLVKTEYWAVPTTSPVNLAGVRTTLGAPSGAAQLVTQQYVNSAVAPKANDSAVVHLAGNETISGVKQFAASPSLPTPVQPSDAATKGYVDSAVQNSGGGSYLSTSGGTMTGTLTLSGDPVAPNQAATKHYADLWAAVKADLIAGLVPPSELGTGAAGVNTCLLGNQTWGPCGSGGSSSYINNVLVASPNFNSTTPAPQSKFLNCTFQNTGSNVTLECPYGNSSSSFALGSQAVLNNQANTYGTGLQDFSAASLKLPSGAGYAPASSGAIGFDTTANLPVININGITQQLALTTSNISGQASTALALAATPTQCSGSFATGIQANGNANCSTASVLQLAETAAPAGIPNYGIFWFDSTTHTPRVIDNNGQIAQLGLVNAFNSDANTLEEYNGSNPQTFNLYGTRPDAADYERLRLGYDTPDGYFVVATDAIGNNMQQRGLGFWLQNSLRWVIDSGFNFKPWSDNVKDIGAPTLRVKHLYLGTYADLSGGALVTEIPNEGTTGTALNRLAKLTGTPAAAITAATSDTNGIIGIVTDGAGTSSSAQIARGGQASCIFDGATTAGDYVQVSSLLAGDCHDAGASYPSSGQVLGRVLSTNAAGGTYAMLIAGSEMQAAAGTGSGIVPSTRFGGTVVQTGASSFGVSIAKVYVSAVNDGQSGCAKINDVIANYMVLPGQSLVLDMSGDQPCGTSPIPATFANQIEVASPAIYHMYGTAQWVLPNKTRLFGVGATTPMMNTEGFVIQACNNDTHSYCGGSTGSPNSFPANTPLLCLGSCSTSASAASFDTQLWNTYVDCNYIAGCTDVMNYYAQENSGVFLSDLYGWANGGVGLDIGTSSGAGSSAQNSIYWGLTLNNTVTTNLQCTNSATGIRVNMGNSSHPGPKFLKGVTVINTACSVNGASSVFPNDDIQVAGNAIALEDVHCESYNRACVNVGVVTVGGADSALGAQDIKLDSVNTQTIAYCSPSCSTSGPTDVVRLSNAASVINVFANNIAALSPHPPTNTINDQNNVVIPQATAAIVTQYVTDKNGKVTADSSGVNAVNFTGGAVFSGLVTAPTPSAGDNSTKVATTAWVQSQTAAVPWFTQPFSNSNGITLASAANKAYLYGVLLTYPIATTQVTYYVVTADNTANTYDIGIYQGNVGSDTLLAHVGPTAGTSFAPSTGWKTLNWTASTTLQPGRYYLAITSSCTSSCAQTGSGSTSTGLTFQFNNALGVASGGTLPASITAPADNYTASSIPAWSVH